MSEQQHKWSGESIAGRYLLGKYLGGTGHSAVFATEIVHARAQQVAIKLIPAVGIDIDRQFARWKALSAIAHTNLLKILDYGKCDLEGAPHLFVVTEYADEDLADILTQRALSGEEARGMIDPVLETLAFLHGHKLVHTRLHPGNILATGDQIKLSSDSIVAEGEPIGFSASVEGFSPPEWNNGTATAVEDVWSLGATVIAALTQKPPAFSENNEVMLPPEVTEPFASIAREALKKDPTQRITLGGVRHRLNPASAPPPVAVVNEVPKAAVKESAKIDPVAVPLSKVPPTVMERRPSAPARVQLARDTGKKSYWMPIAGFVVVVLLLISVPKLFRHGPEPAPVDAATTTTATAPAKSVDTSSKISMAMPKKSAPSPALTETSQPATPAPATKPAVKTASKSAQGSATRGEVLDQVLPDVSEKARGTIQGKVRISVRVRVNPSGSVDSADLDSPASSKYFSEQAIKAAKKWQFSAPEADGHSVASEWLLHFEFTPSATTVQPKQVSP